MSPETIISGMPYVPGIAHGILQHGTGGDLQGRIVLLEGSPATLSPHRPAGYIVVDAAPLSHAMIPLLGSGVPTVLLTRRQAQQLQPGRALRLDGCSGRIGPAQAVTGASVRTGPFMPAAGTAAVTADGTRVSLRASVRDVQATGAAVQYGAPAIGLVRSEFLAPGDGRQPDAAFYQQAFHALCVAAGGRPVTIRLIDIAADKFPAWLPASNPAAGKLGRQGVQLYREEPFRSLYLAQLEAIRSLATEFPLRLLLPYVTGPAVMQYWVDRVRESLPRAIPVGVMAETPAAALQIGPWLEVADFVGLGCNDLMQCLFGADRDCPELRHHLDPRAPVLYRFLREVVKTLRGHTDRVQLCGVLPQLPGVLPVLLGLGFRVFSVEALQLPWLARIVADTRLADAVALAQRVCQATSSDEVRRLTMTEGSACKA